jgi:SAM-dependent methyltransferase
MVRIARDAGLDAEGIEISEFAIACARQQHGVELQKLTLDQLPTANRYDGIHLNHVFEHFLDPAAELAHLRRLLRPGGILYIEVPFQFTSIERWLYRFGFKRPELSLHSLHHPYFYSPATLRRLLQRHGFEVLQVSVFDPLRYPADSLRQRFKKALWRSLARLGIGIYIEIFVRA